MINLLDRFISFCFGLIFLAVPLTMTPWNYELFEFNKMLLVYALTSVIVGMWLLKMILTKRWQFVQTPLDIPLWLFTSSQLVSSIFSIDAHLSWFGYYSRFNGGMWSVVCYVLLYHAFTANLSKLTNWTNLTNLLRLMLVGAVGVAIYGVLQRMGIDKHLWIQDVQNRVFSTLGQPNWLAAYLVALIPLTMALALRTENRELKSQQGKYFFLWSLNYEFWVLISMLFFYVLLNTRSRSGLIGFVVADVALVVSLVSWLVRSRFTVHSKTQNVSVNLKRLLIPHLAIFLLVFFHGTYIPKIDSWITLQGIREKFSAQPQTTILQPQTKLAPLEDTIGISESGDIRRYVWEAAVKTWLSSPKVFFIGTGTETFAYAFFQHKPVGHNLTSEWDFLYNKAHNEYLNYLATTGIFGLASYLVFMAAVVGQMLKVHGSRFTVHSKTQNVSVNGERTNSELIGAALFAGWLSILVTNFFGFSVVVTQLQFFLFPAMIMTMTNAGRPVEGEIKLPIFKLRFGQLLLFNLVIAGVLASLILIGKTWYADSLFAAGYRANRSGDQVMAEAFLRRANGLSPMEPLFADEFATTLATLTVKAVEKGEATRASELAREAIKLSGWATTLSPNNTNYWKNRTKIFYAFAGFDQQFIQAAIESLTNAYKLSPADPKIVYNLAILYGRAGDNNKAVETLKYALELKPNYRDSYFALSVFYTEMKKPDLAKAILQEYLTKVDPKDVEFLEKIK